MKTYIRLLKYLKNYKRQLSLSLILSIIFSVFSALSVYLTIPLLKSLFFPPSGGITPPTDSGITSLYSHLQYYFERFIFSGDKMSSLVKVCFMIIISYLIKNVSGFYQSIYMQYAEKGLMRDVRNELYHKINSLSVRYFSTERTGNLLSRMSNDLNMIQSGVSAAFFNLTKDPLLLIIFLALALSISWQMTLLAVVVFPLTVFAITKIGASLKRRSQRAQAKLSDIFSIISETIYGAKIIRTFRAEKYLNKNFEKESQDYYKLIMKSAKINELTSPITEMLSIIAGAIIIWFGGRQILISQSLKPEEFLGFLFIIFQLMTPIKNLSTVNNRIQESIASGERIFEILDYPIEVIESANPIPKKSFDKSIEIKNVSFYYTPGIEILKDINFDIKKSEVVAIVGSSGCGKSTLLDLIARFYDVTGGEILYDGINVKDIKIADLRSLIGIVPQETILFNDTIRNNIIFGLENITDEQLTEAVKSANAYDFIIASEKGFDTIVGERGLKLSGGQKQRLSIARALLRNPQILILDEATSSLDSESEIQVQHAIDKLMVDRTSIVVAHRLSTVQDADKMVVLDKGRIVQIGKHADLVKEEGSVYKKLYEIQYKNSILYE
jgi:subfamily B ATP-binding cassette protein MsbA